MIEYFHALEVLSDQCCRHLACMRSCPTQAIRVRNGKPVISAELCVDCGICITACTTGAIRSLSDPVDEISKYKYKVLVLSETVYPQFDPSIHPYLIHEACRRIGFDEVVDVGAQSTILGAALVQFMKNYRGRLPLISSHCPAIIRLIQVKYPDLVELILPLDVPLEITAGNLRKTLPKKLGLKPEEIGIVYAAPCPARVVSIKQPAEKERSWFDVTISIRDLYSVLHPHVLALEEEFDPACVPDDFSFQAGWVSLGSVTRSVDMENWLAVSGLDHVTRIFDDIENSRLRNVDFVEALACMLGCIGGPYNIENPYVARTNSIKQRIKYETKLEVDDQEIARKLRRGDYSLPPIRPRPTQYFDTDLVTSIKRVKERERVYAKLPQIDCGCCGAPTCMAFAEDYVHKQVELTDCIIIAREIGATSTPHVIREPEQETRS